jgi:hypothetical protein
MNQNKDYLSTSTFLFRDFLKKDSYPHHKFFSLNAVGLQPVVRIDCRVGGAWGRQNKFL